MHVKHWYFSLRIGMWSFYEYSQLRSFSTLYIKTTLSKFINISTYHTDFSLETDLVLFYFKFEKIYTFAVHNKHIHAFRNKKNDDLKNLIPLDP